MGLDILDITFGFEKAFSVKIPRDTLFNETKWLEHLRKLKKQRVKPLPRYDITIGELHDTLCNYLRSIGREIPADSWERVTTTIADSLGVRCFSSSNVDKNEIRRESWLFKDLGAS